MRQAVKTSNGLTVRDEARELTDKVRSVRLVLIKAKAPEAPGRETLLEKEAACCNLATD